MEAQCFTTQEQSNKLVKLGLNPNTTIYVYFEDRGYYPIWSLSTLVELLEYNAYITINHDGVTWSLELNGHDEEFPTHFVFNEDNFFDLIYKGICWMLENKHLNYIPNVC